MTLHYCDHNKYGEIITVFKNRFQGFEVVPTSGFTVVNEEHHILWSLLKRYLNLSFLHVCSTVIFPLAF